MDLIKKIAFTLFPEVLLRKLRKRYYAKKFLALTGSEEPEMEVLRRLLLEGDIVLDIGANFGMYTSFLSRQVGNNGRVISFEPIPEVFGYLQHNISVKDLSNVELLNIALSNESGRQRFHIPKFEHSGQNFYEGRLAEKGVDGIEVEVELLDDQNFSGKVSFVKCDVEGAELLVVKGGAQFIEAHRPIWMLEINSNPFNEEARELIAHMEAQNYMLCTLYGGELKLTAEASAGVNYFFIPLEKRDQLKDLRVIR